MPQTELLADLEWLLNKYRDTDLDGKCLAMVLLITKGVILSGRDATMFGFLNLLDKFADEQLGLIEKEKGNTNGMD